MEKLASVKDFEEAAKKNLPKNAFDYYSDGANAMSSLKDGQEVYSKVKLKPRLFADPSKF